MSPEERGRQLEDELWSAQALELGRGRAAAVVWVRRGRRLLARTGSLPHVTATAPRRAAEGTTAYAAARDPRDETRLLDWLAHLGARVVRARDAECPERARVGA